MTMILDVLSIEPAIPYSELPIDWKCPLCKGNFDKDLDELVYHSNLYDGKVHYFHKACFEKWRSFDTDHCPVCEENWTDKPEKSFKASCLKDLPEYILDSAREIEIPGMGKIAIVLINSPDPLLRLTIQRGIIDLAVEPLVESVQREFIAEREKARLFA